MVLPIALSDLAADFSDLIDPDALQLIAEELGDVAGKNVEMVAQKTENLKQTGLNKKLKRAKKELLHKLDSNIRRSGLILGSACYLSLSHPSWTEAARPLLAFLAFHLGTETARKVEEDISRMLSRRRQARANGHLPATSSPSRVKNISIRQARKNMSRTFLSSGVDVAATAMIIVQGLSTNEIIGTYLAYFTSMTFLNYGIKHGILSTHQVGDRLANSENFLVRTSGKLMHNTAQIYYRHSELVAAVGAAFAVGGAFTHVFQSTAKESEIIAHKAGELSVLAAELAKGGKWVFIGAAVAGVGLMLDKAWGPLFAEERRSLRDGVRILTEDWDFLKEKQPFRRVDQAVGRARSAAASAKTALGRAVKAASETMFARTLPLRQDIRIGSQMFIQDVRAALSVWPRSARKREYHQIEVVKPQNRTPQAPREPVFRAPPPTSSAICSLF